MHNGRFWREVLKNGSITIIHFVKVVGVLQRKEFESFYRKSEG
jgi:hypothetical protein